MAERDAQASSEGTPGQAPITVPPLIRRNTIYLAASQAFIFAGYLVPALGSLMIVHLLGSPKLAGIPMALMGLTRFISSYPAGKVMDTYGRKVGLVSGVGLNIAGTLMLALAVWMSSFPLLLVALVAVGIGNNVALQVRAAATDMYPPRLRARVWGLC